ncbi:MAG TPA: DNA double-strand break repair nuclease NurA [Acidilobales archaeon]|nr:DNA double-strand break repair nuclease NurA [Acidilobales archaeon]
MFESIVRELIDALMSLRVEKPRYELRYEDMIGFTESELRLNYLSKPLRYYKTGAVDAASINLYVGFSQLAIAAGTFVGNSKTILIPYYKSEHMSDDIPPIVSSYVSVRNVRWVTDRYVKLGVRYLEDPELPEGALAHDIRISLETFILSNIPTHGDDSELILIDGPVEYPLKHPLEESKWNIEVKRLNEERVRILRSLVEGGRIPLSIVKRVGMSKYLVRKSVKSSELTDTQLIYRLLSRHEIEKPIYIGPIEVRSIYGLTNKYMFYLIVPSSSYIRSFSIFRVEVIKEVYEYLSNKLTDVLSYLALSTYSFGLPLPYKLNQADRASKKVVSAMASLINGMLKIKGITTIYEGLSYE